MPKFNDNVSYPNKPNPELLDSFLITDFNDNKRTKTVKFEPVFELIADYFNNTDSPLSQNNVFRFVNLSVVIGDATNPTPTEIEYEQILLDKINLAFQSLNLTILQTELIIFKVNAISYGTFNTREIKYFMPAPIGKGVYEPLSDFITAEQLEIAYRQNATTGVTPPIVIGAPGMYVFELGNITVHGLSILDFLNTIQDTAWPNGYDLSDTNTLYFFNYTLGSSEYLMFFDAANSANGNGFYGDQGDFLFTSTDLVLLYDSSTPSPVVVDAVPEAPVTGKYYARRNLTWREILLKNIADMPSLVGNAGKVFSVNITENGFEWVGMTSGGSVGTLQEVTDNGNETTNDILVNALQLFDAPNSDYGRVELNDGIYNFYDLANQLIFSFDTGAGSINVKDASGFTFIIQASSGLTANRTFIVPNEDGTFATQEWANSQGFEKQSNKGVANGYTPLNASSKIDATYLPDSILGQVNYQGTWNASTNSPSIPSASSANKGHYYIVNVAGTTTINGINDWQIGDWIISNGTTWSKVDNTDAISSFNGRTGAITLVSTDVTSALTYTPENSANKGTVLGNLTSTTIFTHAKGVVDYVASLGYWVAVNASSGAAGIMKLFTSTGTATDGTMTQKAITDALALITPIETTTDGTVTSGVSITVSSVLTIPAGTYSAGMTLDAIAVSRKTGTAGTLSMRFYANTTPDLSGSPILLGQGSFIATNPQGTLQRLLRIKVSDGTGAGTEVTNVGTTNVLDYTGVVSASQNVAINWNNTVYIIATNACNSGSDSARTSSLKVRR